MKLFAARATDDVWIVDDFGVLQHLEGSAGSALTQLDSADDPRILPLGPGAAEIRAGGRWYSTTSP